MKGSDLPPGKQITLNSKYCDDVIDFFAVTSSPKSLGYILKVKKPRFGDVYLDQWVYLMRSPTDLTPQTPELLAKDSRMRLYKYGDDYFFLARAAKKRK